MKSVLIVPLLVLVSGCSILEKTVDVVTPEGKVEQTTVGDIIADNSEEVSGVVEGVVGTLTGNPMAAGGAAAIAAALLGSAARRRKKTVVETEEPKEAPKA